MASIVFSSSWIEKDKKKIFCSTKSRREHLEL